MFSAGAASTAAVSRKSCSSSSSRYPGRDQHTGIDDGLLIKNITHTYEVVEAMGWQDDLDATV